MQSVFHHAGLTDQRGQLPPAILKLSQALHRAMAASPTAVTAALCPNKWSETDKKCLSIKMTIPCEYDPTSALVSHKRPQWQMPSTSHIMFLSVLFDVWERDRFPTLIQVLFSNAWQFISQLHQDRWNCRVYWIETNNWHCFWFGFHKKPSSEETLGELGSKLSPILHFCKAIS